MKKLLILVLFVASNLTVLSCTKEPIVDEVTIDSEGRRTGSDPMGLGPGIDPN